MVQYWGLCFSYSLLMIYKSGSRTLWMRMFADDVKIWSVNGNGTDTDNHSLQEDLSRLIRWFSKWLLQLLKQMQGHAH